MHKVIICIHGRSKKPAKDVLSAWWKASINEGLVHNTGKGELNIPLRMAYFTDITHDELLAPGNAAEPYVSALPGSLMYYDEGWLENLRAFSNELLDEPLTWLESKTSLFSTFSKEILALWLRDLGDYYNKHRIRERIQQRLIELLIRFRHHEIILISHSMGSVIAYDVLRRLGRTDEHHDIAIEHFITLGSPLGLTAIQNNVVRTHGEHLRTPTVVTQSWRNFAAAGDFVAIDNHLADDFKPNSRGVRVVDTQIYNDYPNNPHKVFGYLRAPEFSEFLQTLL